MIACLTDYIGFRGLCTDVTPESGIYINDLPGMSLDRFESMSDADTEDFQGVWSKIEGRALDHLASDIRKNMPNDVEARNVIANVMAGDYRKDYTAVIGTANYSGQFIRVEGSQYFDFVVNFVQVYLSANANVPVFIFDAQTGQQLYTETFTGITGHNRFQINQTFTTFGNQKEYFVCYDDTGITSYETYKGGSVNYWDLSSRLYNSGKYSLFKFATVAKATSPIEPNLDFASEGKGLLTNYNVICSINNYICQNREPLKYAMRFKMAMEMMIEVMENDTLINRYTLIPNAELEKRAKMWEEMYLNEMEGVLANMRPLIDNVCFRCKTPIYHQNILP